MKISGPVIVLGGGGHARVVISALKSQSVSIIGFTDPEHTVDQVLGVSYLGNDDLILEHDPQEVSLVRGLVASVNRRKALYEWVCAHDFSMPPLLHAKAVVDPSVSLESGSQVMSGAVIQPETFISENTIVNTNASVDHECWIGAHTHIAPGATITGSVRVGSESLIGANATVIDGVTVGPRCTIGAGAVVTRDVPPGTTAVGVPARPIDKE